MLQLSQSVSNIKNQKKKKSLFFSFFHRDPICWLCWCIFCTSTITCHLYNIVVVLFMPLFVKFVSAQIVTVFWLPLSHGSMLRIIVAVFTRFLSPSMCQWVNWNFLWALMFSVFKLFNFSSGSWLEQCHPHHFYNTFKPARAQDDSR